MEASGDTGKLMDQEKWMLKYSQPANVKLIGVWDTVGSIGLAAGNIEGVSSSQFDYLQTGLRIHMLNGYHALAIDEHRNNFAPTLGTFIIPKTRTRSSRSRARLKALNSVGLSAPTPTLAAATRPIISRRNRYDG
jgi:hypothetical protein